MQNGTRILTLASDARQSRRTVCVRLTLSSFHDAAFDEWISDEVLGARAHGPMLSGTTFGTRSTRRVDDARVVALFVDAGSIVRTVVIGQAGRTRAGRASVASETFRTVAHCQMVLTAATSVDATLRTEEARIHARALVTLPVVRTVLVLGTFTFDTLDIGVSVESDRTTADGASITDVTFGVLTAKDTWIGALASNTNLALRALRV